MDSQELLDLVTEKQRELFPQIPYVPDPPDFFSMLMTAGSTDTYLDRRLHGYLTFTPAFYFQRKFIDWDLIKKMKRRGAKTLFCGSGLGQLEILLHQVFDVPQSAMVLSDINQAVADDLKRQGYIYENFDLKADLKQWRKLWRKYRKFNVILFPQSLGSSFVDIEDIPVKFEARKRISHYNKVNGKPFCIREGRIEQMDWDDEDHIWYFYDFLHGVSSSIRAKAHVVTTALLALRANGEIRISGLRMADMELHYFKDSIKIYRSQATFTQHDQRDLFIHVSKKKK